MLKVGTVLRSYLVICVSHLVSIALSVLLYPFVVGKFRQVFDLELLITDPFALPWAATLEYYRLTVTAGLAGPVSFLAPAAVAIDGRLRHVAVAVLVVGQLMILTVFLMMAVRYEAWLLAMLSVAPTLIGVPVALRWQAASHRAAVA